jgi:alkanesulfonate monooxygenase SsuD/methylene tetrahydromethanopterin reductase-like flavin-dependent oxidoreductase (luciferase family)
MAEQRSTAGRSRRPLKVGIVLQHWTAGRGVAPTWTEMQDRALRAEALGFDSIWLVDHLQFRRTASALNREVAQAPERPEWVSLWESFTVLSALAVATTRVELGTLVTCTAYRNPAMVARIADTIDEISGGRVILGLGAGNHATEFDAFGYPWGHRVSRFEEALRIIVPLLRQGEVTFEGQYYQARETLRQPRGPREQGPPILIGAGPRSPRMLRLAAQYADQWNGSLRNGRSHGDQVSPLRAAVDAACQDVGRDPATLARTIMAGAALLGRRLGNADAITGEPEQIADRLRSFAAAGIDHVQIYLHPNTVEGIEALAPALELLDQG